MKPIVVTASDIKRELVIWGLCLFVSIGVNIYAIIVHDGFWAELYTQLHIELVLSIVFYLVVALVRGIGWGIKRIRNMISGNR